MINWTLLQPRNVFMVAVMGIIGYMVFQFAMARLNNPTA